MAAAQAGLSSRAQQIVDVAAAVLAEEGREALTMRRVADRIGIRAPSLYKHFSSKEDIEDALIRRGLDDLRASIALARRAPNPVDALVATLARFARNRPHLYGLLAERQLAPLLADDPRERALLVFAQGMVALERDGVAAPDDAAHVWNQGLAAFRTLAAAQPPRTVISSVRGPD